MVVVKKYVKCSTASEEDIEKLQSSVEMFIYQYLESERLLGDVESEDLSEFEDDMYVIDFRVTVDREG